MDESNIIHLQDLEEEEEADDEALSLRGLVLNSGDDEESVVTDGHPNSPDPPDIIRPSSEQFFEFFNEVSSEMSHAEDIILCGKLVPFKEPAAFHSDHIVLKSDVERDEKLLSFHRRRSESMPEFKSSSSKNSLMRNSRSLDYQKMYGSANSSMKSDKSSEMDRSSSIKASGGNAGKNDGKSPGKSKWHVFLFGPGKFPLEMALQDIKSRQERRSPGTLFASLNTTTEKEFPDRRTDDRRSSSSSWDILKILSCKDDTSVAVTASFGCLQHV